MQTATNPETGETVVLVGSTWHKVDSVATNNQGEKAFLVRGKWLSGDGEADLPPVRQQRDLGTDLVRQVGLTARAGIEGVAALPNMVGDALGLRSTEAVRQGLTRIGLPEPENATERVSQDVAGALAGMGGVAKVAQAASPSGPVGQAVARTLHEALGMQSAATGAAAGAAGTTREMGGGPGSQLAAGLAAGVAAPYAAQRVAQAPANFLAQRVRRAEQTPFAQEGARLREATGIDLSPGQSTGSKLVLGLENTARQFGPTADRVQDIDARIAKQAIARIEGLADRMSTRNADPETLGGAIQTTVTNAARHIDNLRDKSAATDYGRVRELAGDQPVIKLQNFADELRKMIDEYQNVAGADAQKITAQARAALARVTGQVTPQAAPGAIVNQAGQPLVQGAPAVTGTIPNTIGEAMKSRSFYGKASRGAANVFEDIAPNLNRTIGARLFRAVNDDFDDAAANANGELRAALDNANRNYRRHTQSLEYLQKSALGKLVGEDIADAAFSGASLNTTAGETVVQRLATAAPSTRKAAVDILERWNPDVAKDLRANVLRQALDKAMSIPPSQRGASQVPISFNRFISALQGDKASFDKQLQSYGFRNEDIADIKDTVAAMLRAGDRTGYNASGTHVQSQNMEIASAVGAGMMGNVKAAATKALTIAGKQIGLNQIASAMETPAGREAIRTLSAPKASPQAVAAAFATVEGAR